MSREHEDAKAAAQAEVARFGNDLPLTRRQELRDAIWDTADQSERAALRAEYALAGWRLCKHSDCSPDHCRR
jgi:hypothetical protein